MRIAGEHWHLASDWRCPSRLWAFFLQHWVIHSVSIPTHFAAAPLVLLGSLSRTRMIKVRGRLLGTGKYGKQLFGLIMLAVGVLIATGTDKSLETWVFNQTPDWLTALTTKY
jgi:hypothetical protein